MRYISRKVIKGQLYYYLQYKNYTKNLGNALPGNLREELLKFFYDVYRKEYKKMPVSIKKNYRYGGLDTLEYLHYFHICLNHELFVEIHEKFYEDFIILFTYHSNRQEGSKVTRKEIEKFAGSNIRKPKTKTDKEIHNSFQAFKFALSDEMKWNMKSVKKIHKLLLGELDPLIAGKWKNENNVAPGNELTTSWKKVPKAMKELMLWLKKVSKKNDYPPTLALRFYCRFEKIHPFLDGNGRVGRILLNAILHRFHYPPVIFFTENQQEHFTAIRQALKGRWSKMFKHYLTQIKKTEREVNRKYY